MKWYATSYSTSQMYLTCDDVWEVYLFDIAAARHPPILSLTTYSVSFTQCINFKVAVITTCMSAWIHGIQPYFLHTEPSTCVGACIHGLNAMDPCTHIRSNPQLL